MKARWIFVIVIVGAWAATAAALPISYISAAAVPTSFTPIGGNFGLGQLEIKGSTPIIVHLEDGSQVVLSGHVNLTTSLNEDNSSGGIVDGYFEEGAIAITASGTGSVLTGPVLGLTLQETFDDMGVLGAKGLFKVSGGSLMSDFGEAGSIYQILFQVQPAVIGDLTVGFSGYGNLSIAPTVLPEGAIPEPVTVSLLSIGLAGLALARRKRR